MPARRRLAFVAVIVSCLVLPAPEQARAQPWPDKPIRFVCPFPAGGAADAVTRMLAQKYTEALGRQVLVDNRAGAGGVIGVELAAKAPADGYTVLLASSSNFAFGPSLEATLPYNPQRDFAPVALAVMVPNILVAHPSVPVQTVKDLIQLAKGAPGTITFASPGTGTTSHIIGELFAHSAGIRLMHVPYKGGAPAANDLLGGHVQLLFGAISTSLPQIKAGKLKGLGVTSAKRSDAAPEIPTLAESGLPGFEVVQWFGVAVPAATSAAIVDRLNGETMRAIAAADFREGLNRQGLDAAVPNTPRQFSLYIRDELARWTRFFKDAGLKLEQLR
ncbi:MAG: tripartite tricarboxylate transporter substrate binding protein [Proteobacteria bacterium]|nr:tripartite tricarboxylate transporter substrate binding protein [Burkholderiales bacterium]